MSKEKALQAVDRLYKENNEALQNLAEIEREERMTEEERIQVIKTACGAIGKYSDALKELSKPEKEELKAELESKKKQNFQLVADACMEQYQKTYGSLPDENEYWRYLISDGFETGCGRTICVMVTQGSTEPEDFSEDSLYTPTNSIEYRCVREFHKHFGTYNLYTLDFVSKEDFFKKYSIFLPQALVNLKDKQCYMHYHSELHFNFA